MSASSQSVVERFHPRVAAGLTVKVMLDGRTQTAKAKDLSMAGLYLVGRYQAAETLEVCIPLPGREVVSMCRIRRRHKDGVGLEFEGLDWDDMIALARFVHPRLPEE